MALDGIVLNKIVEDLNKNVPIRINKIYSIGKNEILLNTRADRVSKKLIISGDANQNRIHFTNKSYPNDSEPSNFVMLLRKHLSNGQILAIKQYNFDRIIQLEIINHDSIGDLQTFYLYLELMGRYANIIFCNSDNIIFDAIKRISPLDNPNQVVVPGARYEVYANLDKANIYTINNFDINDSLVNQFSGVSPTLEKEIRYRLANNQSFESIVNELKNSNKIIISSKNNNSDYHIIELRHAYDNFKEIDYDDAFDIFYYEKSQQERIKSETSNLLRFLRKEVKKLKRKITKIEAEIIKNENSDINLKNGDLIMTYQYQVKKGMTFVNLIDYDTNEEVSIALDEKLDAIANAQKYYKLYKKQSKSISHLNEQIKIANREQAYFELLIEQLSFADVNSAKEIRAELVERKYLFEKTYKNKRKERPKFTTINYNGINIKLGKNNIQNDYILKSSNRNDYWFHIADYHGSHVVVQSDNLTDDLIEFAATLAARFSQVKDANNVTVNYTEVKNLKKTNQKGLVSLKQFKSITIRNDYSLIKDYI